MFVFLQDNAPAHRARDTVELLRCETPQLISPDMWPANSRELNPDNYCIWAWCRNVYTKYQSAICTRVAAAGSSLLRLAEFQQIVMDDTINHGEKDWKIAYWNCMSISCHLHSSHFPRKVTLNSVKTTEHCILWFFMQARCFSASCWKGSEWRPKQKLQTSRQDSDKVGGLETRSRI